jgi:hypothetical protein
MSDNLMNALYTLVVAVDYSTVFAPLSCADEWIQSLSGMLAGCDMLPAAA